MIPQKDLKKIMYKLAQLAIRHNDQLQTWKQHYAFVVKMQSSLSIPPQLRALGQAWSQGLPRRAGRPYFAASTLNGQAVNGPEHAEGSRRSYPSSTRKAECTLQYRMRLRKPPAAPAQEAFTIVDRLVRCGARHFIKGNLRRERMQGTPLVCRPLKSAY